MYIATLMDFWCCTYGYFFKCLLHIDCSGMLLKSLSSCTIMYATIFYYYGFIVQQNSEQLRTGDFWGTDTLPAICACSFNSPKWTNGWRENIPPLPGFEPQATWYSVNNYS